MPLERAIRDAKINISQLDQVVLVVALHVCH